MTDTELDQLVAEAREQTWRFPGYAPLLDALTAEREKVAALEKENAKFRTMLGGSTALAEGLGIRTDAIMQEVALAAYKQLEEAKADTARWHHIATEMAEAIEAYENSTPRYDWNRGLSDALESYNRFSQGS